jgi:hypothetical protein
VPESNPEQFPLVAARGKTREELLAVLQRSREIVGDLHEKRVRLEKKARQRARTGRELDNLMKQREELADHAIAKRWPKDPFECDVQSRVRCGFPPDCWLPWRLTEKWKASLYPKEPSAEAIRQWQDIMEKVAALAYALGHRETASRVLEELAHDLDLLRQNAASQIVLGDQHSGKGKSGLDTFDGGNAGIKYRQSRSEQEIVKLIREVGIRLTTTQLLSELNKRNNHEASEGTTKNALSALTRAGVLNNRSDVRPRGYGFPDWK